MIGTIGATGLGVVFGVIAAVLMYHHHADKLAAWLMLLAGLFGSSIIVGWLGSFLSIVIFGAASLGFLIAVAGGIAFWIQVRKNKKHHHIATPVLGLFVGVSLMVTFGGVRSIVGSASTQVTSVISHQGSANIGGRP